MDYLKQIQWYHIAIVCLSAVLLFLIFTRQSCSANTCKNAQNKPEGFTAEEQQEQKTDQEVKESGVAGEIILYYAMWCGYSRAFLPEWEKFEEYAKKNLPYVRVSRVRCEDGNEATCVQKGVEGYPTVILYPKNNTERLYEGERKMEKVVEFVQNNLKH
ncbi:thioredoxin [Fadolivirus algeromassiliense]|jgi:thiol-disulfide isomerase/thioredoxin|uniref:Thioredoxin n=1 Tax=Fadolivirus FV1/VV64 TaxID=3070911 RepID=A0A7D3V7J6_9VIRU|nr:thioredoxin [Fadolivirus algeromassiliense]QKF93936.1 thioredoxin [Fadolivirus FV1/VV64]